MAIYLSFLVPKITAIVHAMPTNPRPTPSAWNHEHNRLSDFVPIASLLEWQWPRIVMRNGQFYHPSRNGASWTAQCREIPHLLPEPFYPVLQAWVGKPTPPSISTRNLSNCNKSLKDPVRGGQALPKCRYAIDCPMPRNPTLVSRAILLSVASMGRRAHPPPLPPFLPETCQVQQILERPSEGGQAPPKCRYEAIIIGRVGIWQEK